MNYPIFRFFYIFFKVSSFFFLLPLSRKQELEEKLQHQADYEEVKKELR